MVSCVTKLAIAAHIPGQSEGILDSVKVMQRAITGCSSDQSIRMECDFFVDRGYSSPELVSHMINVGADISGTHKKSSTFCAVIGSSESKKKPKDPPFVVVEHGAQACYWAEKSIKINKIDSGKKLYGLGYRSGL